MAQELVNYDRPIQEGYYEVFTKNDTLYICGPNIKEGNFVVTGMTLVQGDIYDISYCPENQTDDMRIIRCHIITAS